MAGEIGVDRDPTPGAAADAAHRTETTATRRLELLPVPGASPRAREVLRALLSGTSLAERLDDAELALSELVTNAVLHSRDVFTVTMTLTPDRLRVDVCDRCPVSPSFSMLDPTAVTGRGLLLVSAVSDGWGSTPQPSGKCVWFELRAGGTGTPVDSDVDALLAAWGDDLDEDPAQERVRVVLTDLDTALTAQSEAHVEGLLRELALLSGDGHLSGERQSSIRGVLRPAGALDMMRADLRRQLSLARSAGQAMTDVTLTMLRQDARLVQDLDQALNQADRLSRQGDLLTAPAPIELSEARTAYLRRIVAQLTI